MYCTKTPHRAWWCFPLIGCVQLLRSNCHRSNYPLKFTLLLSWVLAVASFVSVLIFHLAECCWGGLFALIQVLITVVLCSGMDALKLICVVVIEQRREQFFFFMCSYMLQNNKYSLTFLWVRVLGRDWAISGRLCLLNTELEWLWFPEPEAEIFN